jgi:hypothetical protein
MLTGLIFAIIVIYESIFIASTVQAVTIFASDLAILGVHPTSIISYCAGIAVHSFDVPTFSN